MNVLLLVSMPFFKVSFLFFGEGGGEEQGFFAILQREVFALLFIHDKHFSFSFFFWH